MVRVGLNRSRHDVSGVLAQRRTEAGEEAADGHHDRALRDTALNGEVVVEEELAVGGYGGADHLDLIVDAIDIGQLVGRDCAVAGAEDGIDGDQAAIRVWTQVAAVVVLHDQVAVAIDGDFHVGLFEEQLQRIGGDGFGIDELVRHGLLPSDRLPPGARSPRAATARRTCDRQADYTGPRTVPVLSEIALDGNYVLELFEPAHHSGQLGHRGHLQRRYDRGRAIGSDGHVRSHDIDLVLGHDLAYVGEQAGPVVGFHAYRNRVGLLHLTLPLDFDYPRLFALPDHGLAAAQVNGHALPAGDEADDRIARDGVAALPETNQQVPNSLCPDPALMRWARRRGRRRQGQLGVVNDAQAAYDLLGADCPIADRGEEVVDVVEVVGLGDLHDAVLADGAEVGPGQTSQLALERLATVGDVLVTLLALEPLPDLLLGMARPNHVHPVA